MEMQKQNVPFTMVPNQLLNSPALSLKAKGMYSYMFGKPNGWNFTIRSIAAQIPEGVDAISSSMNELKSYGWLKYKKLSSGKGIYTLVFEPNQDNPKLEKPARISNKDINNNTIKEEENIRDAKWYYEKSKSALDEVIKENPTNRKLVAEINHKISDFAFYCEAHQKNYSNYPRSFWKYYEIAKAKGWK